MSVVSSAGITGKQCQSVNEGHRCVLRRGHVTARLHEDEHGSQWADPAQEGSDQ